MKCLQCSAELQEGSTELAYCPKCKAKRKRNPADIDPETGEWTYDM